MEQAAVFEREMFSPSAQNALEYAYARAQQRASLVGQYQGALSADAQVQINAEDLLAAVSVTHGNDSPVRRLMDYFGVPFEPLDRALQLNAIQSGTLFPDTASFGDDALTILNTSESLGRASRAKTDNEIHLRHLFGGVLWRDNAARDLVQAEFERGNIPFAEAMTLYNNYLETDFEYTSFSDFLSKNPRAQTKTASSAPPPNAAQTAAPTPPTPAASYIPFFEHGFDTDTVSESDGEGQRARVGQRDLVGIGAEVDAFAYLISAKTLTPPLAIGLFGNWGSGKSFFMQALHDRIDKITKDARDANDAQADIYVYKSIVQIEFNAWHYVEGDLWASLVGYIFQNLRTSHDEQPTLLQARQRAVLEKLKSEQDNLQAKQAILIDQEKKKVLKEKEIEHLKIERDLALQELNELKAQDILATIHLSEEDKRQLNEKIKDFGVPQTMQTAAEFTEALDELRATLARGNALTTPLRERGPVWAIGLIVVIFSGPVISFVIAQFSTLQIPALTNALLSIAVFLSGLTAMVKLGTGQLANMIARVEAAQQILDQKRREKEAEYLQRLADKEKELAALQTQYAQAKSEEKEITLAIAELEQALAAITPSSVLLDFIRARASSEDYSKRLGLAALIRQDFEQLSKLIDDHNDALKKPDSAKKVDPNLFNRIVLYIDDLDRCPPDRVVQVLQAVHLLLAFPLFVVVVAVDARWLSQSLEKHYGELLGGAAENGKADADADEDVATPRDYLEKIFQIPFWVRPLTDDARVRIVQGLLGSSMAPESTQTDTVDANKKTLLQNAPTDPPRPKLEPVWKDEERQRQHHAVAPTNSKPPSLMTLRAELEFMQALKTLLGETPRGIKRFVNLYRLLKAVALTYDPKFTQAQDFAAYQLVLFLLALLTGTPNISNLLFRRIKYNNFQPETNAVLLTMVLAELEKIEKAVPPQPKNSTPPQTAQDTLPQTTSPSAPHSQPSQTLREIKLIENWLNDYDSGKWKALTLNQLAAWVPQVERFSFQMEQI